MEKIRNEVLTKNKSIKKHIIILIIICIMIFFIGLMFGNETINIFNLDEEFDKYIILNLRLPRLICGFMAGATLAASGLLIQTALKNELTDSSILGFQSGATLFAIVIILIYPNVYNLLPVFTFIGGMLVFLIIFFISLKNKGAIYLIITGLAIGAIIRSFINLIEQLFSDNLENTLSFMNGSLNSVDLNDAFYMLLYGIILLVICIIISYKMDILLFSDQQLISMGISPNKIRFITVTLAILLTAISVSFIGMIAFVGLLGPHISRRLVHGKMRNLMPITILIGGILVMGSDTLQRIIFPVYDIPVGTIMSLVGGIFLVYLLLKKDKVKM